jgi:hypothetical protein
MRKLDVPLRRVLVVLTMTPFPSVRPVVHPLNGFVWQKIQSLGRGVEKLSRSEIEYTKHECAFRHGPPVSLDLARSSSFGTIGVQCNGI